MPDISKEFQLEVIADLARLQSDLAKIPGYTEKSAASAALKLEQQFLKVKLNGPKDAAKGLEGALELAHHKARVLGGALSLVSPELGASVREAGHLAGGLAIAGKAAGSLYGILAGGVAIAAAAALYKIYEAIAGQVEEAEKKELAASNEAIKAEIDKVSVIQFVNKAIIANERLAALEKKKIYAEFWHTVIAFAEIAAVDTLEIAQKTTAAIAKLTGVKYFQEYSDSIDTIKTDLEGYLDSYDTGAIDDQIAVQEKAIESNVELAKSYDKIKKNKAEVAKLAKAELESQRAIIDAQHELARNDGGDVQLKQLQYALAVTEALAKADDKVTTAEEQQIATLKDLVDARDRAVKSLAEYKDQGPDLDIFLKEQVKGYRTAATEAQNYANVVDSVGHGTAEFAQNIADANKESSRAQVAAAIVSRAAALASIAAHTGQAIAAAEAAAAEAAVASGPLAPVTFASLSAGMQASIIASAAFSTASVLSQPLPSYHSGGIVGYDRGGGDVPIVGQKGESMLNRAATSRLGQHTINALNRGARMPAQPIVTANVYTHRAHDAFFIASLSRWNSPTRVAVQKVQVGVRPGHRERTA